MSTRSARKRPSESSAISAVVTLSRPCASPTKCSLRSASQPTERPSRLAASRTSGYSRYKHVLGAEAAADVLGDDAQGFAVGILRILAMSPWRMWTPWLPTLSVEPAGLRVIFANGRARLHIVGDRSRVYDLDANCVRRARERLIGLLFVADMGVVSDVAGRAGEDKRRLRPNRLLHVDRGGKLFPCDADQFGARRGPARSYRRPPSR